MKYTYSIQKVSFYVDEFEDKGSVDVAGAIEAFEKFPFEEQLEERKEQEVFSAPFPSISFQNEAGKFLRISAQDEKGFFLHYQKAEQCADFYISNNYEFNPVGFSPEECIGYFFDGTIETTLKDYLGPLEPEDEDEDEPQEDDDEAPEMEVQHDDKQKQKIAYHFSEPSILKYLEFPFYVFFVFGLFFAWVFISGKDHEANIVWFVLLEMLFALIWLPPLILYSTYYRNDKGVSIEIDKTQKTLSYMKDGELLLIHRSDIERCRINRYSRRFSSAYELERFSYLMIILKDGKKIAITSFIAEPETIASPLHLKYELIKGSWPAFL